MASNRLFRITENDITSKSKFVAAINRFLSTGVTPNDSDYRLTRGEAELLHALAEYFKAHTEIPDEECGSNWLRDLPLYLVEAFEEFRTHPEHQILRDIYRGQTDGDEIPDLLDVTFGMRRSFVITDLVRFLPDIADRMGGTWLEVDLKAYFTAQDHVIDHAWRRFVRHCYRPIAPRIKAESHRGNSGLFGRTTLRSYVLAGRIMFTFARSAQLPDLTVLDRLTSIVETLNASAENKLAAIEAVLATRTGLNTTGDAVQISFVGDENDMLGLRSGMNTPDVDYRTCVDMIEDVIAHWDPERFVEDRDVGLG